MNTVSERMVGRLSMYRRLLNDMQGEGSPHVFSHVLARMAGVSAAQVRRDIMNLGFTGNPSRGYDIAGLIESIARFLDPDTVQKVALVGIGNLGRAIMAFFSSRRPSLVVTAAFDIDPTKTDRTIHGVPCCRLAALEQRIAEEAIRVAVITAPADQAQSLADRLVAVGVQGILNFAPVPLRVPPGVYVEQIDMTMSLEKVAFFARRGG